MLSVSRAAFLSASLAVLVIACGGGSGDEGDSANASANTGGGVDAGGSNNSTSGGFGTGGTSGTPGRGGNGSPEVCDGIDNDGNGVIDDVDEGNDGICDCLRIATLGEAGEWGEGDVFAAWLNEKSTLGATSLGSQVLTPALLAGYQVIVAQDVRARAYSTEEVQALADWVKGGGGFMTLIGYGDSSERTNVNTLLATFGMSYKSTPVLAKSGNQTIAVATWATHPIADGVQQIGVDNGYEVDGLGATVASEQGITMLKAQQVDRGRVVVWGDEWITYNSEWSTRPDYQVARFWVNTIKWLTPSTECQVPVPPNVR